MLRMHTAERILPGRRLGRNVVHDPRSLAHPAPQATEVKSVVWDRKVPVFDQGNVGSCTGNAMAGCLSTDPFGYKFGEKDALRIYSLGTRRDRIRGVYPPTDTGCSGLGVMKAAVQLGLIAGYSHAFGIEHVLKSLTLGPGITGITWLEGCDNPDESGLVKYEGRARGGHEIELFMIDAKTQIVGFWNSWGPRWGDKGRFYMTWTDYNLALKARGDATFSVPR